MLIRTDIYAVAPNGTAPDNIRTQLDLSEEIKAPVKQNQVLGTVTYHADGMVYSTNLVAAHDVRKKPFWLYNSLVALGILLILGIIVRLLKRRK